MPRRNLPYKRYGRRRKFNKRYIKPKSRATTGWIDTGRSLVALANDVFKMKKLINSELKFNDVNSATAITNTGVVSQLTSIAEGDDYNNRNGRSILGKGIQLRYRLVQNSSATQTTVRVILVADKENTGSAPTVSDILEVADIDSPWKKQSLIDKRFTYIYDKTFALNISGNANVMRQEYIPYEKHVMFTGTAAADTGSNHVYMLTIGSEATNTPTINYYSRMSFYDN